jgi:hypothetical protein
MAFAALIAAYQETEDREGGLRALLPMAGRSLLEHQVRRAMAAGASHAVVLVERIPAALNAALDRLRRDGIAVTLARDPMDAADHFHPEEHVLLVADGLVAAPDCFDAMAARASPALLVVADVPANEHFERVDAEKRWAGLALTNVETIAATAQMLGDWDLQSTLMRRIVQGGADFLPVDGEAGVVDEASEAVVLAERSDKSRDAGKAMLSRNRLQAMSWPEHFLYGRGLALLAPLLLDFRVDAFWLRVAAVIFSLAGAAALWWGWLWTGFVLLLLAGPIDATAGRIDLAQLRSHEGGWEVRYAKGFAQALAILALGHFAARSSGENGYFVMAAAAVALLVFTSREMALFRRIGPEKQRILPWMIDGNAAIWLALPFAIAGQWSWWPLGIAVYASISLFFLQNAIREAVRQRD